ncbi:hypothetical protein AVEN_34895-1 [Araneus ventricosus]|uniref:Uncharacterized protein n=1 Tax=Araneus ventricosus TaxID=182803 RepID=A0A4Y2NC43_ARAVE|nr:hypothetical protein AVEN_34895-1 [Araneus ventricosus]
MLILPETGLLAWFIPIWFAQHVPETALQVIEGLMPLHIKAKMKSTLVRLGRLGRICYYDGIHFDHESYEQLLPPSIMNAAHFVLEDRISLGGQGPSNRKSIEV